MVAWGRGFVVVAVSTVVAVSVPAAVSASEPESAPESAPVSVLLTPVQGSESLRVERGERVTSAVRQALEARGYSIGVSQDALGQAVIACQTPECVEQALDAAGALFAVVPALWTREAGGEELTLTLVQRSGRSLNASRMVEGELDAVAGELVDELLARLEASAPGTGSAPGPGSASESATASGAASATSSATSGADRARRPHAWKAGPVVLIAGGAAAFIAIGVAAGVKNDSQQLNRGAVAAWSVVGAAAIAGGVAWLVVGNKRRRRRAEQAGALPELAIYPTGFDLRLRF